MPKAILPLFHSVSLLAFTNLAEAKYYYGIYLNAFSR